MLTVISYLYVVAAIVCFGLLIETIRDERALGKNTQAFAGLLLISTLILGAVLGALTIVGA